MSVGSAILDNLRGNTEHAYLVVRDYRAFAQQVGSGVMNRALQGGASPMAALQRGAATAANAVSGVSQAASAALQSGNTSATALTRHQPKYFKVQFNPSELQLNGIAGYESVQNAVAQNKNKRTYTDSPKKPTITLSVNLYFDQMNHADAFMMDKFRSGASVETVTNAIALLSGKEYSVQPQVEALIGALRNNYTRDITFYWGKFSFSGHLSDIRANYTMFSTSGRPVRAQVLLRMHQELDPELVSTWYSDFAQSFQGGSKSLTSGLQKVGNLLNINL